MNPDDPLPLWVFDGGEVIDVVGEKFRVTLWNPKWDVFLDPEPPCYDETTGDDLREVYRKGDSWWQRIA